MTYDIDDAAREGKKLPEDPFEEPTSEDVVDMKSSLKEALNNIYDRMGRDGNLAGATTGYNRIDEALDGWEKGKVYVVGGRSGMGKSIFGLNVGLRMGARGYGVDYVTLEMPVSEQAIRAMFCWSGVDSYRLKTKSLRAQDFSALVEANKQMCKFPWAWNPKSTLNIEGVREHVRRVQKRMDRKGHELHAVVIDHVLNIKGTNERQPRREQLIHITQQLKSIAKDEGVCVIALTQLNRAMEQRGVKDKRPRISDLKESGSFEEDADAILLLYRQDRYEKDRDKWDHVLEVSMPKIRGGEESYTKLHFDGSKYRISNLEVSGD